MSNPSIQKGTAFESLIAAAFAEVFPGVERRALAGAADRGDIGGVPGLVVECKNVRTMSLCVWVDEARAEAANVVVFVLARDHAVAGGGGGGGGGAGAGPGGAVAGGGGGGPKGAGGSSL